MGYPSIVHGNPGYHSHLISSEYQGENLGFEVGNLTVPPPSLYETMSVDFENFTHFTVVDNWPYITDLLERRKTRDQVGT